GQGACQAIESAWVLAKSLANAESAPAGLLAYEQARFDRTAMITNQSWRLGKILAYENPLKCWLRDRLFGLLGGLTVRETEKLIAGEGCRATRPGAGVEHDTPGGGGGQRGEVSHVDRQQVGAPGDMASRHEPGVVDLLARAPQGIGQRPPCRVD